MVQQLSKSKETSVLKAGHPLAVKAGGKRVAKKSLKETGTHEPQEKKTKRSDKLSNRLLATSNRMQQVGILLTGTLDKLSHDFPPVSVRHGKVCPTVEKPHSPRTFFIQQPRKC
ncbi:hypothetical protein PAMP_003884 [Pampus punctatissimus]